MEQQENNGSSNASRRRVALFKARNKRISLIAISACVALLVVSLIILCVSVLSSEDKDDGLILENVYVAGIHLGGMNKEDAEAVLRLAIGDSLSTQDMVVSLPDDQLVLSPAYTQAFVDITELVDAAYDYGRSGTKLENRNIRKQAATRKYYIALLDYMYLDLEYIRETVDRFCSNYTNAMIQTTVSLKGSRPDYKSIIAEGIPISSVKHQTLVINMGIPQFSLDADVLYAEILDAYSTFQLSFTYDAPIAQEPELPDAQELFDLYCTLPVDASMDGNTFKVTPEIYGYGFDIAEAARRIHRAEYGDTVTITLGFLFPDITEDDLNVNYFQDILATFMSTATGYDADRNTNLRLACEALNGTIIKPGETFDFNQILGPCTENAGYKRAPTYAGSSTTSIGGGISQIASALHYCAMLSELQITESHFHTYAVSYSPYGTDAFVSYGTKNLVFTNNTADPIQILTSAIDSTVIVSIMGTETHSYDLVIRSEVLQVLEPETEYAYMLENNLEGYVDGQELESGITGYVVAVYVYRYDPITGAEISRQMIGSHTYSSRNQLLVKFFRGEDDIQGVQ